MTAKKTDEKDDVFELKKQQVDPSMIQKDDLMAFVYYGKVKGIERNGDKLQMEWVEKSVALGEGFGVDGEVLVKNAFSADRYTKEEKVSTTECMNRLMVSFNRPFTVCWDTKDTENRVLRGTLVSNDPLGYSNVEDMDAGGPRYTRFRKVDHRTLHWLIVDGIKFIVGRKR